MNDDIQFLNDPEDRSGQPGYPPHPTAYQSPGIPQTGVVDAQVVDDPNTAERLPQSRAGLRTLSWLAILGLTGLLMSLPFLLGEPQAEEDSAGQVDLSVNELQAKYIVGYANLPGVSDADKAQIYPQADAMNTGPFEHRLAYVILTGELRDALAARDGLTQLLEDAKEADYPPTDEQMVLHETLDRLYADYEQEQWDAPSVQQSEREELQERLGWFGELALTPDQSLDSEGRQALEANAQSTVLIVVMGFVMALGAGGIGFIALIVGGVSVAMGRIKSGTVRKTANGNIYIETFALWFVLFFALGITAEILLSSMGDQVGPMARLVANAFLPLFSLFALAWPLIRGVPSGQLLDEIGLKTKNPIIECIWGGVCYLATLPLLFIGIVTMILLMAIAGMGAEQNSFAPIDTPSHPIVEWLNNAGWGVMLLILFLAAVVAPIVEEIMFRGVLYRHLRDITARQRLIVSVVIATIVNSFIFAAIHPQGIFGIPVLMSLAIGFSLAREWRGSLIAPMIMHAINNAVVTLFAFSML